MPYVKPDAVVEQMVQVGVQKSQLPIRDLLTRGFLSGAFLGFATTLAFTASLQTKVGFVGALAFPVGFVMIVLLGLELVTGNFALLPLGVREGKMTLAALLSNWAWVFLGNLIGSVFYALLFTLTLAPDSEMAKQLIAVSEAKTLGYAKLGGHGLAVVLSKAILCNWMVTLGVAMAMTSQSTIGKIAAMWLPSRSSRRASSTPSSTCSSSRRECSSAPTSRRATGGSGISSRSRSATWPAGSSSRASRCT